MDDEQLEHVLVVGADHVYRMDPEHSCWRDVGTIDASFDVRMDLSSIDPVFDLYNP